MQEVIKSNKRLKQEQEHYRKYKTKQKINK